MSTVTIPTAEAASITTGLNLPDTETPDEGVERILAAIRIMTPNNEGLSDEDVFSLAEVAQRAVSESTTLPGPEVTEGVFENVNREAEDGGQAEAREAINAFRAKVEAEFGPNVEVRVLDENEVREAVEEARRAMAEFNAMMESLIEALFGGSESLDPEGEPSPFESVGLLSIDSDGRVEKIA
jgi:hypothetical protein